MNNIDYHNTDVRETIMDMRDERIRLQRRIVALQDILFWDDTLTPEQYAELHQLLQQVQSLKDQEQCLRRCYLGGAR